MKHTHKSLTEIAVKWLRRPESKGGPNCCVAVSEVKSGWNGEVPDAIGFRLGGSLNGSFVVEAKASRSDFLIDKNKPHRQDDSQALGRWRFFICPEGLISPDEIPDKWGLLYVTDRGYVKPVRTPYQTTNLYEREAILDSMSYEPNLQREMWILIKLLDRVGDQERLNKRLRKAEKERDEWKGMYNRLAASMSPFERKKQLIKESSE